MQTFIAGFTAAGETASPPMEQSQGHSQTRISIIFFIPQKKKKEKEIEGEREGWVESGREDGLDGSSKREAVYMGVWGRGAEEGNHRRITSEGLCVSVKLNSLSETVIYTFWPFLSQSGLPASVYHAEHLTHFQPNHTSPSDCGSLWITPQRGVLAQNHSLASHSQLGATLFYFLYSKVVQLKTGKF